MEAAKRKDEGFHGRCWLLTLECTGATAAHGGQLAVINEGGLELGLHVSELASSHLGEVDVARALKHKVARGGANGVGAGGEGQDGCHEGKDGEKVHLFGWGEARVLAILRLEDKKMKQHDDRQ